MLAFNARFIPAMPIAGSKPPMVVGIRHTNKATNRIGLSAIFKKCAIIGKLMTTIIKVTVITVSKMPSAISFGVFWRLEPSTKAIMRSKKLCPTSAVTCTIIRSVNTLVPPITPERSVPASRRTGADSPVTAASLMVAKPYTISPSEGINSPARTSIKSLRCKAEAEISVPSVSCKLSIRRAVRFCRACLSDNA